jgi:hypothetical protein
MRSRSACRAVERGVRTAERQRSTVLVRVPRVALAVEAVGAIVIRAVNRCAPTLSRVGSICSVRRPWRASLALIVFSLCPSM